MKLPSLKGQGAISVDCETCDPDLKERGPGWHRNDTFIAGIGIGTEAGFREYFPLRHEGGGNVDASRVLPWLKAQLALPVPKVGANLAYDLGFLNAAGIDVAGPLYDIQIAEPLIDETARSYSLEALAQKYLKKGKREDRMVDWIVEHLKVRENKAKNFIWKTPGDVVRDYAIADIDLPIHIWAKQKPKLERLGLWELFEMERKLIPLLVAMRRRGVAVNLDRADELYQQFTKRCDAMLLKIKKQSGIDVDIWAAASIAKVFDKLKLKYPRTKKIEAPSFKKDFLTHHPHPVAKLLHEVRHLDKLKETFIRAAIIKGNYKGRIYCSFNQLRGDDTGTVSGRFSSSAPNLQQVPVRGDDGKMIRSIFIPDRGCLWHKFDWSQIEYRLMVNDAVELGFRSAQAVADLYHSDPATDFHQAIADMCGIGREPAKSINFGLSYGMGLAKLARQLGIGLEAATKLLRRYHKNAPFMRPLMQHWMERAETSPNEVRTLFNRLRHFNKWMIERDDEFIILDHRIPGAKRAFTYSALNARIQGSAADLMKQAMVEIEESGALDVLGVPHITCHDELDFSAPKTRAATQALAEIKHIMENVVELNVPLLVDHQSGPNWGMKTDKEWLAGIANNDRARPWKRRNRRQLDTP